MAQIRKRQKRKKISLSFLILCFSTTIVVLLFGGVYYFAFLPTLSSTNDALVPPIQVLKTARDSTVHYQIVFSTGCNSFTDWQSYVFFYHAGKVLSQAQPPFTTLTNTDITRIVSGCLSGTQQQDVKDFHAQQLQQYPNFHLHFTPEYATVSNPKKPYRYFNKPLGVQHWLHRHVHHNNDNDIFILMDPDMILVKPLTYDFFEQPQVWSTGIATNRQKLIVKDGQPFAQHYGFGTYWFTKTGARKQYPSTDSHNRKITNHFSVGPPYLATGSDFRRLVDKWAELVVPLHENYRGLFLAEMYAYSLAAFELELPHQVANSFMLSDVKGAEWEQSTALLFDDVENRYYKYSDLDLCSPAVIPAEDLPNILHYCNRYWLGKWFFEKYHLPDNFLSCESPLLRMPPKDIALRYSYAIDPKSHQKILYDFNDNEVIRRNAFMLCQLIPALNQAAIDYKQQHCTSSTNPANLQETLVFHEDMETEH